MEQSFKLSNFEGPLDLLLHLISKSKIEIKDIFVSEITEQYLACVRDADALDMETASEFLQMAATLLYIKSRSLLPEKRTLDDVDEEGLTPEEQLIRRLNEYKLYKEVSEKLKNLEDAAKDCYYKLPEDPDLENADTEFSNATADMLFAAFEKLLQKVSDKPDKPASVSILPERFSVKRQAQLIMARLAIYDTTSFFSLLGKSDSKEELAATFLAVLELTNDGKILLTQEKCFGDIIITKNTNRSE